MNAMRGGETVAGLCIAKRAAPSLANVGNTVCRPRQVRQAVE
jgi:hypothetical protein